MVDLFAGCRGLSFGFEAQGFETHGFGMDTDSCATYKKLKGKLYLIISHTLNRITTSNCNPTFCTSVSSINKLHLQAIQNYSF
ncbi:hypothetical protein [Trichormus azollae]|uniref:hypothetical protein n=1 Tax=Trichormus azollae TaxID=1164 RepID=UPI00325D6497